VLCLVSVRLGNVCQGKSVHLLNARKCCGKDVAKSFVNTIPRQHCRADERYANNGNISNDRFTDGQK
jgi:hypothetical protein